MSRPYDLSYQILNLQTSKPLFEEVVSAPSMKRVLVRVAQKLSEQSLVTPAADLVVNCVAFGNAKQSKLETLSTVLTLAADHYRPIALREAKQQMTANLIRILQDDQLLKKLCEQVKELALPVLDVGDTLMIGKFKNRKAVIKGFDKDEQNQPVAQTDKGDVKILKVRVAKLMPGADLKEAQVKKPKAKIEDLFPSKGPIHAKPEEHAHLIQNGWRHLDGLSKHDEHYDHYEHKEHGRVRLDANGSLSRYKERKASWISDMD